MIATGWVTASLAYHELALSCLAVAVFVELAVPLFVVPLAAELGSDAVFVASPLRALAADRTVALSISAAVNSLGLARTAVPVIATGWVTAFLACCALALSCLAVVVFVELAVPLFVVPLALVDQTVFLLTLLACVGELGSDAVFVASPLCALADRVA